MAKKVIKEMSELKRIRVDSGVDPKLVAEELGVSYNHYLLRENGKRKAKTEQAEEKFFFDVCHIIEKLKKEQDAKSESIVDNLIEDEDKLKNLSYRTLTPELYIEIRDRLKKRENLIVVCSDYYVDYEQVENLLVKEGLYKLTITYRDEAPETLFSIDRIVNNEDGKTSRFVIDETVDVTLV